MLSERIERLRKILDAAPENILARFSLSQAYFDARDYDHAIAEFRRVIEQKSDWMLAYLLLGRSLIEIGRSQEARPILEQGLKLAVLQGHQGPQADFRELIDSIGP